MKDEYKLCFSVAATGLLWEIQVKKNLHFLLSSKILLYNFYSLYKFTGLDNHEVIGCYSQNLSKYLTDV